MDDLSTSGVILQNSEFASTSFTEYVEIPCQGFNVLYKAKRQGRWFILKRIKARNASKTVFQNLLNKEYELTSQLNHQNIVSTFFLENDPKIGKCIVMEYVDGYTLQEFLQSKPSADIRMSVVNELLDALQYIHSKQIIHKDLKPSNILISRNGNHVKIIDFGLSDSDSHTILKQPAGSREYASPEQMQHGVTLDCRSDIYSFGKILSKIFPWRYRHVVRVCTKLDREKRYSSATEIQSKLKYYWGKRILALIVFCSILVIGVLSLQPKETTIESEISPEKIEEPQPDSALVQSVEEQIIDTTTLVTKNVAIPAGKTNSHKTTKKFDAEEFKRKYDNLYKPFTDSLSTNKFVCREDAIRSYTALSIRVLPDIWVPLKDAGVFHSLQEELDIWQKYAVPLIDSIDATFFSYTNDLPICE